MKVTLAIILVAAFLLYQATEQLGDRIAHNNYQHRAILCAELPESKGCEEFGTAAGQQAPAPQNQPNEGTNP